MQPGLEGVPFVFEHDTQQSVIIQQEVIQSLHHPFLFFVCIGFQHEFHRDALEMGKVVEVDDIVDTIPIDPVPTPITKIAVPTCGLDVEVDFRNCGWEVGQHLANPVQLLIVCTV